MLSKPKSQKHTLLALPLLCITVLLLVSFFLPNHCSFLANRIIVLLNYQCAIFRVHSIGLEDNFHFTFQKVTNSENYLSICFPETGYPVFGANSGSLWYGYY